MSTSSVSASKLLFYKNALQEDINIAFGGGNISDAAHRQLQRFNKKFLVDDASLSEIAISKFKDYNEQASRVAVPSNIALTSDIFGEASDFIYNALYRFTSRNISNPDGCLDLGLLISLWRFGPGASNGVQGTHFVEKIHQPMTTTVNASPLVACLRHMTPRLREYDLLSEEVGFSVVSGNKLTTVAKNDITDRTIAIEPSGNMALQLGAGAYIEGALRCVGNDISVQASKNKALALRSSIDGTLATIDLEAASDLITPSLIRAIWPLEWYQFFMLVRSPVADIDGVETELHMMSNMGNGFTFPMMTLTLLALVYGLIRSKTNSKRLYIDYNNVGVFGDDIILPSVYFQDMCSVLVQAGLQVNTSKSFWTGDFRESCGGDFKNGEDVTPFYVKSLSSDSKIYSAINASFKWAALHHINLWRTWNYFYSLLDTKFVVPFWEDPSSGIRSLDCEKKYKLLVPLQNKVCINQGLYDSGLHVLCVLGGYVESNISLCDDKRREAISNGTFRANTFYLPRARENGYKVKTKRFLNAYVDGYDPLFGDRQAQEQIARWVVILTA